MISIICVVVDREYMTLRAIQDVSDSNAQVTRDRPSHERIRIRAVTTNTQTSGQPLSTCCAARSRVRSLLAVIGMVGAMIAIMIGAAILGFGMTWPLP